MSPGGVSERRHAVPSTIQVRGNGGDFVFDIVQQSVELGANTVAVWEVSPSAAWLSRRANVFSG